MAWCNSTKRNEIEASLLGGAFSFGGAVIGQVGRKRKYNWSVLGPEFIRDICTVEEFAKRHNIPVAYCQKKCTELEWQKKREEFGRRKVERTSEKTIEKISDRDSTILAKQIEAENERSLCIARKIQERVDKLLGENLDKWSPKPFEPDLRSLALTAKTAQEIARKALNADLPALGDSEDHTHEIEDDGSGKNAIVDPYDEPANGSP